MEQLKTAIRAVREGCAPFQEVALDALNQRGGPVRAVAGVSPLRTPLRESRGAVRLMDEVGAATRSAAVPDAAD